MNTTPANRIIKESHGSIPGISFNKKKKNKKEPIPSLTNVSITSFVLGSVVNLPDNTNIVCKITNILKITKKY